MPGQGPGISSESPLEPAQEAGFGKLLACACGAAFKTAEDMEVHFVAAFVPDDDIGLDGKPHFELDQERPPARLAGDGKPGGPECT